MPPIPRKAPRESRAAQRLCCAAFSPDGKTLVTGGRNGTLKVWDPATGKQRARRSMATPRMRPRRRVLARRQDPGLGRAATRRSWSGTRPPGSRPRRSAELGRTGLSRLPSRPTARRWPSATSDFRRERGMRTDCSSTWRRCSRARRLDAVERPIDIGRLFARRQDARRRSAALRRSGSGTWSSATRPQAGCSGSWSNPVASRPSPSRPTARRWPRAARRHDRALGHRHRLQAGDVPGHAALVLSLAFAPDGRTLASAGDGARQALAAPRPAWSPAHPGSLPGGGRFVVYSPDGQTLATGGNDQLLRLWDAADTGRAAARVAHRPSASLRGLRARRQDAGHRRRQGMLTVWDPATGKPRATLDRSDGPHPRRRLRAGRQDAGLGRPAGPDARRLGHGHLGGHPHRPRGGARRARRSPFRPTARRWPSGPARPGRARTRLMLFDVATFQPRQKIDAVERPVVSVAFAADGKTLAAACSGREGGEVILCEAASGRELRRLPHHVAALQHRVLARRQDAGGGSRRWDDRALGPRRRSRSGRRSRATRCRSQPGLCARRPDARQRRPGRHRQALGPPRAAAGPGPHHHAHTGRSGSPPFRPTARRSPPAPATRPSGSGTPATKQLRATLEGHTAGVTLGLFTADGKTLITSSYDRTIKVWDLATKRRGTRCGAHAMGVTFIALSPDGKTLASSCDDKTVRLWDPATRQGAAGLPQAGRTDQRRGLFARRQDPGGGARRLAEPSEPGVVEALGRRDRRGAGDADRLPPDGLERGLLARRPPAGRQQQRQHDQALGRGHGRGAGNPPDEVGVRPIAFSPDGRRSPRAT